MNFGKHFLKNRKDTIEISTKNFVLKILNSITTINQELIKKLFAMTII